MSHKVCRTSDGKQFSDTL
nr:hypothetical protein [Eisenbergiella tayi]